MIPSSNYSYLPGRAIRIALGLSFLVFLLHYLYPLFTGTVWVFNDLGDFVFPLRNWYSRQLHAGESFLWMPDIYGGYYLHGEGQQGMLHPVHLLLFYLFPATVAFNVEMLLAAGSIALGCYRLFSWLTGDRVVAGAGAFWAAFGGVCCYRMEHPPNFEVWAHTPWILLAMARFWESRGPERTKYWAAIALITGLQCLTGAPQFLIMSALVEVCFLLYLWSNPAGFRGVLGISAAKVLGILAGAVQLYPTLELGNIARKDASFEFLSMGSVEITRFFQWFNLFARPPVFSRVETSVYCGTGTVLLAVWAFSRRKELGRLQRWTAYMTGLGIVTLFLSFGSNNGLYSYYYDMIPFRFFRQPERYFHVANFAILSIALAGLTHFLKPEHTPVPKAPKWFAWGLIAGSVLCLAATAGVFKSWGWTLQTDGTGNWNLWRSLAGSGLVIAVSAMFLVVCRAGTGWRWLFVVATLAEGTFFNGTVLVSYKRADPIASVSASEPLPPVPAPGPVADNMFSNRLLLLGYRLTSGYSSNLWYPSVLGADSPAFESLFGVRAVRRAMRELSWNVTGRPADPPYIWLADRLLYTMPSSKLVEQLDIRRQAVVNLQLNPQTRVEEGAVGKVQVLRRAAGFLQFRFEGTGRLLAVVAERYHPGWNLRIDGKPAPVVAANGDLLGAFLDSGNHEVEFHFLPSHFIPLCVCSGAMFVIILAIWLWGAFRKPPPELAA
jgi:hypothetical protein